MMQNSPAVRTILILLVTLSVTLSRRDAQARVSEIEIVQRSPLADGMQFGDVGPYELIRGRLHFAVDPDDPRNQAIVDLQMAKQGRLRDDLSAIVDGRLVEVLGSDPRNEKGEVQFSSDFILLKPVDLSKGNHRLLYDVNNRGNLLMLPYYNNAAPSNRPTSAPHAGDGWLMRQGYSLLWNAWNWDVDKVGQSPLRISVRRGQATCSRCGQRRVHFRLIHSANQVGRPETSWPWRNNSARSPRS